MHCAVMRMSAYNLQDKKIWDFSLFLETSYHFHTSDDMTAAPKMSPRIIYVMSSNCYRYVRSAKCMSTDRVLKHDYRPIPISGRAIGASLVLITHLTRLDVCQWCSESANQSTSSRQKNNLQSLIFNAVECFVCTLSEQPPIYRIARC